MNWTDWFATETDQGLCGVEDDFFNLALSYLGKIDILEKVIEDVGQKGMLVLPGPNKTVRLYHHCFFDGARQKIIGMSGLRRFPPSGNLAQ